MNWTAEDFGKEAMGSEETEPLLGHHSVHDAIVEELSNKDHIAMEKDLSEIKNSLAEIKNGLQYQHSILVKVFS